MTSAYSSIVGLPRSIPSGPCPSGRPRPSRRQIEVVRFPAELIAKPNCDFQLLLDHFLMQPNVGGPPPDMVMETDKIHVWLFIACSHVYSMPARSIPNLLISRAPGPTKNPGGHSDSTSVQSVEEQAAPHSEPRRPPHLLGDADDIVELVDGVEMNGDPRFDGHPDLLVPLVETVENDAARIGPGHECQIQLAGAEGIGACSSQGEDTADGEIVVGFGSVENPPSAGTERRTRRGIGSRWRGSGSPRSRIAEFQNVLRAARHRHLRLEADRPNSRRCCH